MRSLFLTLALLGPVCAGTALHAQTAGAAPDPAPPARASNPEPSLRAEQAAPPASLAQRAEPTPRAANPNALGVTELLAFATADDSGKKIDNLTLEGAKPEQALKALFDRAEESYVFDGKIEGPAISLSVKGARFQTLLDLITQSAGLGYRVENRDGKRIYRVGKSVTSGYVVSRPGSTLFTAPARVGGNPVTLQYTALGRQGLSNSPLAARGLFENIPLAATVYGSWNSEERSTFTCPHCKGQTTVLRHRQQPKCPTCGRTFAADWQFCPADGTRRPPAPGAWKYCPICGKEVPAEKAEK